MIQRVWCFQLPQLCTSLLSSATRAPAELSAKQLLLISKFLQLYFPRSRSFPTPRTNFFFPLKISDVLHLLVC